MTQKLTFFTECGAIRFECGRRATAKLTKTRAPTPITWCQRQKKPYYASFSSFSSRREKCCVSMISS
jgi:hypothetical protein